MVGFSAPYASKFLTLLIRLKAPASSSQRRKRAFSNASAEELAPGRQILSRNDQPANSNKPKTVTIPEHEDEPPRKRIKKDEKNKPSSEVIPSRQQPSKRGRKSKLIEKSNFAESEAREATYEADAEVDGRKRRKRLSKDSVNGDDEQTSSQKKKARNQAIEAQEISEYSAADERNVKATAKKRGRPQSRVESQSATRSSKRRTRRSLQDQMDQDDSVIESPKAKKGQRLKNLQDNAPDESVISKQKGIRQRQLLAQESGEKMEGSVEDSSSKPTPQRLPKPQNDDMDRRQRSEDSAVQEDSEVEADDEDFLGLIPVINSISHRTINSKWSPLDRKSIAMVEALLADAARPVIVRIKDEKKRVHATAAIQAIRNRLHKKMSRGIPFPPLSTSFKRRGPVRRAARMPTEESNQGQNRLAELSYENAIDGIREAEHQFTPLAHSVALLKREKDEQERQLRWDYERLQKLERDAREQKTTWRSQLRKCHPLVPPQTHQNSKTSNVVNGMNILPMDKAVGTTFIDISEPEVLDLVKQLNSHVESMAANVAQYGAVLPAIERSTIALQGILHDYLDDKAYDRVVLSIGG